MSGDSLGVLNSVSMEEIVSPSGEWASVSAAEVVRRLAPSCVPTVFGRMRRERVAAAADLAGLDKEDLRELGFTMLERSRLLRWARQALPAAAPPDAGWCTSGPPPEPVAALRSLSLLAAPPRGAPWGAAPGTPASPLMAYLPAPEAAGAGGFAEQAMDADSSSSTTFQRAGVNSKVSSHGGLLLRRDSSWQDDSCSIEEHTQEEEEALRRLDKIEEQADFWCNIVSNAKQVMQRMNSKGVLCDDLDDVRENILEELFDLSAERVTHLYDSMLPAGYIADSPVSLDALRLSLRRCGLPEFGDAALERIVKAVSTNPHGGLELVEFEAILSRLKLAQLLCGACRLPWDTDTPGGRRIHLGGSVVRQLSPSYQGAEGLTVVDYSPHGATVVEIKKARFREFFFGHRQKSQTPGTLPPVRWVHIDGLDLTLLLALTVKYSLHPLGVEDVIEQCPTKIDRYGCHYFAAVEQLCLCSSLDGLEPVRVHGRHVSIFCSGPPLCDTILTVTEPDHDEKEDWPGGPVRDTVGAGQAWVERLRQRLEASHSRLRERRADFLMYQILDLSSDELVKVTNAYARRLTELEGQHHRSPCGLGVWLGEVALAQRQLAVVLRRLRGLQRVVRHVIDDPDITPGLTGYVTDVRDHIDEAYEDTVFLVDKCRAITETTERSSEREHAYCRHKTEERLNNMIFLLTVATAVMAPMQFMAGVYGMNFVDEAGQPTIPELLWPRGYFYFWILILSYFAMSTAVAWRLYRRFRRRTNADYRRLARSSHPAPALAASGAAHGEELAVSATGSAASSSPDMRAPLLAAPSAVAPTRAMTPPGGWTPERAVSSHSVGGTGARAR